MSDHHVQSPPDEHPDDDSLLVEDQRFSIVPEWVIDADIPDASFRLYSLLLRYGNSSGRRMPSRATLARRLRRSVDAVDRAMRSLSDTGVVRVEHRRSGKQHLPNRYHVRTTDPSLSARVTGGRRSAATPRSVDEGGRGSTATLGRSSAARVAAEVRHDPEVLTDKAPPPPSSAASPHGAIPAATPDAAEALLSACGIDDLEALAERVTAKRRQLGKPSARWSGPCLLAAIQLAVLVRGWPAARVADALERVAADVESRSPARLAEAGPWWDEPPAPELDREELAALEWRLSETGGVRPLVQRMARSELEAEGLPRTRSSVAQRACLILDRRAAERAAAGEPDPQLDPSITEVTRS